LCLGSFMSYLDTGKINLSLGKKTKDFVFLVDLGLALY
jgi:hypothetical protein